MLAYRVVHVGTSLETRGGISAVLDVIFDDAEEELSHIVTHCDGSVLKRITTFIAGWLSLLKSLIYGRRAIYHVHSASYGSWMRKSICILTIDLFKQPIILHMHGGGFRSFYESNVGLLGRLFVRTVLRKTDVVVVLSSEWEEFFKKIVPQVDVVVIPNAVAIPPALKEAHWLKAGVRQITCLGRLWQRKGTWDLMHACAQLGEACELYLAGDGEIERARSLADELGIGSRVQLPGWIDAKSRDEILSGTHVFVLASYMEGLPMALLEAMSYGLPVISTPVGGIPSLIESGVNGLLIEPGDIAGLTQSIGWLMLKSRGSCAARRGSAPDDQRTL